MATLPIVSFSASNLVTTSQFKLQPDAISFTVTPAVACRKRPYTAVTATISSTKFPPIDIPGNYGLPCIGAVVDRLDYFWFQGTEEFFKSRMRRHRSTVFRTNMPPGPFISSDPRVIVLLDGASFPILFDAEKVEKKDVFTGTYMPSTDLTGGYRTLSFLDTAEPNHAKLKRFFFHLQSTRREHFVPEFHSAMDALFGDVESELAARGKAEFNTPNEQSVFRFLCRAFLGKDPADSELGSDGPDIIKKWVLFQLAPLLSVGLPKLAEELLLHTFPLPPMLIRKDYDRLLSFFRSAGMEALDAAEERAISRDEAAHNLLYTICFNSFGGMLILFPTIIKWIGRAGPKIQRELVREVREAVKSVGGGELTPKAVAAMPLVKSVIYEVLRIEPPVPFQYGRARRELVVESHDTAYKVKEGEVMCGYQPFATRDLRIFNLGEEFIADRFVGEEGQRLLKHVLWSNGPESESPTEKNKQCPGKDLVLLVARLLVAEIFLRYDSLDVVFSKSALGSSVFITSLRRASAMDSSS